MEAHQLGTDVPATKKNHRLPGRSGRRSWRATSAVGHTSTSPRRLQRGAVNRFGAFRGLTPLSDPVEEVDIAEDVLDARDAEGRCVDGDTVDRTLEILRRRVDKLGVSEPSMQRSGDRRIIVMSNGPKAISPKANATRPTR